MATLLLQTAGAAIGSVFGPVGAIVGRAVGAMAGSAIDHALLGGQRSEGVRLGDARLVGAEEGAAIPRAYGAVRLGGTLIWATRFEEEARVERQGGKGGGARSETFRYYANFALGLCEGPIACVRRVWADGRELDLSTVEMRVYRGTRDQAPDPLIEAKQGEGRTPAYRGLAYLVFEHFPLDAYGNRLPTIQAEVLRIVGSLENQIRAVTIIPGATEHGYDPQRVSESLGDGERRLITRNVFHGDSDWKASIDELQALCPHLERVALVVSWFGTDLRAGHCQIVPGVETAQRDDESSLWQVAGIARKAARLVSRSDGGPAYGGTPSDASVLAAIADLKARGLKVVLYPFLMMDIPHGNSLPDPYGGAAQAAYPWRGRITAARAPGLTGSPDRTAALRDEIARFMGTASTRDFRLEDGQIVCDAQDQGYRRMVLHAAMLARRAGGVEALLIGSELVGLSTLRDDTNGFPFVTALAKLAGDVRAMLGPDVALTYGADWSEYFGYHPADGSGDVYFHLDALWASEAIDAVGIDNYMPLSDWRDGDVDAGNPDGFRIAADGAALQRMITAGEGYDWYYPDAGARDRRQRLPIEDGLAGKPWVFRVKDIESWWANPHYDRVGGRERTTPTAWKARMKPIWFTELGCPAIDKGANQPNVFLDPKSVESAAPYFSSGRRDDLIQRRFLEAHLSHWAGRTLPAAVDPGHIFLWTWDARPFPAFPQDGGLFADGGNWRTGHWLTGRLGAGTLPDILAAILADHGFEAGDVEEAAGDLIGYVKAEQTAARNLIEPLMAAFCLDAVERGNKLAWRSRLARASTPLVLDVLAEEEGRADFEETRAHESELAGEAVLDHLDSENNYGRATSRALAPLAASARVLTLALPGTMHGEAAAAAVENMLRDHQASRRKLHFSLGPNALLPEPGDRIVLPDRLDGTFLIERIEDGLVRMVEARGFVSASAGAAAPPVRRIAPARRASSGYAPLVVMMDLPPYESGAETDFARAAAFARPWRRTVLSSSPVREDYVPRLSLNRPATIGSLRETLAPGVAGRLLPTALAVSLRGGECASVPLLSLLNGANRLAVLAANGIWEVLGFQAAEETAPGEWRLSGLLRGLGGSTDAMAAGAPAGARVVKLDAAVRTLGLTSEEVGRPIWWAAGTPGQAASAAFSFSGGLRAQTPLAPVHLSARRLARGDIALSWIRCGRVDSDSWTDGDIPFDEPDDLYRLEILSPSGAQKRTLTVQGPAHVYSAADERTDWGSPQDSLRIRVSQIGRVVASGLVAEAVLRV
ncbi:hypothetical protein BJF93_19440 [Xaviernesmea oryzae]|uniref:Uncharacterized protein n=1 Tax=Xaviernesmea oryzae TaxID=464029 RepID=A0A1Q9B1I8_9HYPH|nr:glycoside hydrolase/phage tail family protein [Xaviernesmea oryzae]OLP61860.1 hypothetical protein BJF93_19440 [Xaviernesmea oryzae]SEL75177.1 Putative phage tail protein [Xaviernesmea oryzae]